MWTLVSQHLAQEVKVDRGQPQGLDFKTARLKTRWITLLPQHFERKGARFVVFERLRAMYALPTVAGNILKSV